jgi:WD40 repeat protein
LILNREKLEQAAMIALAVCLMLSLHGCMYVSLGQEPTAESSISTASLPAPEASPAAESGSVITVDNAAQLQEFAQLSTGAVGKVALSPDGKTLAVASSSDVYLYDIETFNEDRLEVGALVYDVAFDPSGLVLAVVYGDIIQLWDIAAGQVLSDLNSLRPVFSVAFDADGSRLASGGEHVVKIWDVHSGDLLHELNAATENVSTVAFSPNGEQLVSGGLYKSESPISLQLWDPNIGQLIYNLDDLGYHYQVTFSPDGSLIASACYSGPRLFETSSGTLLHTLQGATGIAGDVNLNSVSFSPDGTTLISGGKEIIQWSLDGERLQTFEGQADNVFFLPDGQRIITEKNSVIRIWDLDTGQVEREFSLPGHSSWISGLAFSPDGRNLATVGDDSKLRIWDIETGQFWYSHTTKFNAYLVTYHPGGQILAYGGCVESMILHGYRCLMGKIVVLDIVNDRVVSELEGHGDRVTRIAFSSDGQTLVSQGNDGATLLWDYETGQIQRAFSKPVGIHYGPDGTFISSEFDDRIQLTDADSGTLIREFTPQDPLDSLAFSPDGELIASAGGEAISVQIWDISGDSVDIPRQEFQPQGGTIHDMAFGADSRLLAIQSPSPDPQSFYTESTFQLWDSLAGKLLLSVDSPTMDLAFSPDGTLLATRGADGIVRLWGIK